MELTFQPMELTFQLLELIIYGITATGYVYPYPILTSVGKTKKQQEYILN